MSVIPANGSASGVYVNRISTVVPDHDVHETFVNFGRSLFTCPRKRDLFDRMVERAQIRHRWSCLGPDDAPGGGRTKGGFYSGNRFPSTAERMRRYEAEAVPLAVRAVEALGREEAEAVTHLIAISCTGYFAPGIDIELIRRCGMTPSVERTTVGFMGCQAAINGLKLARHIVRSDPAARVLLVSVELCSLHLQDTSDLNEMLMFLIFADGCAAALVTAEPSGLELQEFHGLIESRHREMITWNVRDSGFDMFLSGRVPHALRTSLRAAGADFLAGASAEEIVHWAVHPGGRTVLDAAEAGLSLDAATLEPSRRVLADFGNMSSATILFVLKDIAARAEPGERGCAMAFGPGLSTEAMLFRRAN